MSDTHATPRPVRVGLIGAGFAAGLHAASYRRIGELDVKLVAVAATTQASAQAFAQRHGIPHAYDDVAALLAHAEINLVDLCVPNNLHEPLAIAAARAGKHIVCEKPLTGYFGGPDAATPVGATPRATMYAGAMASAERMVSAARAQGVMLMYAENWLYSPPIVRAERLVAASQGAILEIRAQECHSGSHARYAKEWAQAGGGALLRLGSHPLAAALWLKREEGKRREGRPIVPTAVLADVADLSRVAALRAASQRYLVDDWHDVENWSTALITFSDGTRAVIQAADTVLGGMEDTLTIYCSNCRVDCNLTHSGVVRAFAPTDATFGDEYIMEKVSTKAGWSYPAFDESFLLGYPQEIHAFCESVAYGRPPRSGAELALQVVQVVYAAYRSAEEGRRIALG
ncbi:MAG: Gfo/Idh/MocA family oxidoreductase [Chloroflexota bacterium]